MSGLLKNQEAFTSSNRKVKNLLLGWLDCFPRFFIASRMPRHAERPMITGLARLK
ncbi:Hypothetical protein PMT_2813 [Prochlorococcus marinus str. MIT 9313]|uniref:Uncharacterized protein n=1 Tax=Prochlorococcus marinus (strain MIT 9313) TaxID=74547 RepID=B9ESI6_PROMM|nr:Hypothetical protein PMT_2813 [Prochlorococcus marinus str. MIT 9313]